jgi:hypothetical protein
MEIGVARVRLTPLGLALLNRYFVLTFVFAQSVPMKSFQSSGFDILTMGWSTGGEMDEQDILGET